MSSPGLALCEQCGAGYAERTKRVLKNKDGDNKGQRVNEGRRSTVAELESKKDCARLDLDLFVSCGIARITPIPWLPKLHSSDR